MAERLPKGVILERVTEPTSIRHARVGPPVYVLADDRREALAWAARNKAGYVPKTFDSASIIGPRGLYIPDEPVYVLNPIPQHVREAWTATGAHLVYL